jgi:acyl-coenzyme A synthetase/AMP-(fatty) acid ligase
LSNGKVYVLDDELSPSGIGVTGEIYIGGAGVARGYLQCPELTAERFMDDPYSKEPGARMYRTGDLGRFLTNGCVEFLGRKDQQVKIRGFRIELGEIEAALQGHEGVRQAVVIVREDEGGDKRLVAYVVGQEEEKVVEGEQLRSHLQQRLPEYMVPGAFVWLKELPLTANGKLNRGALPAPEGEAYAVQAYEEPIGEVEARIAAVWAEALKVERVGRHDQFFRLGGHSLMAVTVIERLRQSGLLLRENPLCGSLLSSPRSPWPAD